jgi:hypothetical protein
MNDMDWLRRRSQEAAKRLEILPEWKRESLYSQALQLGKTYNEDETSRTVRDVAPVPLGNQEKNPV